jgi:OOP family OmpA-OmpF porin
MVVATLLVGCGPVLFSGASDRVVLGPPPPVEDEGRVKVTDEKLVIDDKIHFEFDSDVIRKESYDLLAEIAGVIKAHPELARISIEGHASAEGGDKYNLQLSERRAASVRRHLVEKGGIAEARLESVGFGEEQPIADNDTAEGREKNRRVEFMIVERTAPGADASAGTEATASTEATAGAEGEG